MRHNGLRHSLFSMPSMASFLWNRHIRTVSCEIDGFLRCYRFFFLLQSKPETMSQSRAIWNVEILFPRYWKPMEMLFGISCKHSTTHKMECVFVLFRLRHQIEENRRQYRRKWTISVSIYAWPMKPILIATWISIAIKKKNKIELLLQRVYPKLLVFRLDTFVANYWVAHTHTHTQNSILLNTVAIGDNTIVNISSQKWFLSIIFDSCFDWRYSVCARARFALIWFLC